MSGHTPTPWERTVYEHGGSRIFKAAPAAPKQRVLIADTYQAGDANLLFAAPDLLEALKDALRLIESGDFSNGSGDFSNGVGEFGADEGRTLAGTVVAEIEAAIAKAEGKP